MSSDIVTEVRSTTNLGYQAPKAACDECRRRKLRCDGKKPQCSVCLDSGVVCITTQRGVRGPKKGHLRALKSHIVQLEAMLEARPSPSQEELQGTTGNYDDRGFTWSGATGSAFVSTRPDSQHVPLSPILHAELDQLYFDRVHHSLPILHQKRYLSWSKSSNKSATRRCLQHSMWTIASLLSAHSSHMAETLYRETKQMLEYLTANEPSNANTELAQAWVLIVTFESMRTYHHEAWMSAGRAFRLVQGMRYHNLDRPGDDHLSSVQNGHYIELEERRRVFWMAYFLDHVISMRDNWPITLNEHVICTRLPAPDVAFQASNSEVGPFLSEAMTESTVKNLSAFNECLILSTVCGRSLLQTQRYHISKAYGDIPMDWTDHRKWLESVLIHRLQVLSQCYPSPSESFEPLLLFAHILGQATMIYCCKEMQDTTMQVADLSSANTDIFNHHNRALEASSTIIQFGSTLRELPFSKIHPLMPIPLFICAEFLYSDMHVSSQMHLRELFGLLRELKNVNNPDQSYLDLLPRSCVSKTTELLKGSVHNSISGTG
ncbi:fungal-specific transcription factor domain-containing protein [Aspergillus floccosus]